MSLLGAIVKSIVKNVGNFASGPRRPADAADLAKRLQALLDPISPQA